MDQIAPWLTHNAIVAELQSLLENEGFLLDFVIGPRNQLQIALIVLFFVLARLIDKRLEPMLVERLRSVREHPRIMRFLLLVVRRMHWILFVVMVWAAYAWLRATTWPSHSYLLGFVLYLTAAWVVITITSRVIANRLLRRAVVFFVFSVTALDLVGLLPRAMALLDAMAVQLGDVRVSLLLMVQMAIAFFVLLSLAIVSSRLAERRIRQSDDLTPAMRELIVKLLRPTLLLIAAVVAITVVGVDLTALAVFSGALGLGIGFGLQKVVSNLISGIILLLDESIKPGDVISLGDTFGWITELGARYVAVRTREGRAHLIPNEDLITQQVINWTHSSQVTRLELTFKVAYESNPHQVREVARTAAGRPGRVLTNPPAVCHLYAFGDSSLDFIVRFWIDDPTNGIVNIQGEVLLAIWDALREHGIAIPLPHRRIIMGEAAAPLHAETGERPPRSAS